jgi:DNA-binding PadR family transcriptional regulator
MMKQDIDEYLPLAPATLHILLSLAGEPMHGYGIMQEVLRQSGGRYNLGPGTLYDNLQRLMKQRMVEEVAGPREEQSSRRRYYRLSTLGRGVLSQEIARLEDVVQEGRIRLRSLNPRRA